MIFVLLSQLAATLFMAGLIWFVQIVHYPLFAAVGSERFPEYEANHQRLTTFVVMPVMLLELATAIALIPLFPAGSRILPWIGLILLIAIWLSTWGLQVPAHKLLASGFSTRPHHQLVKSNWIRTMAWTARAAVLLSIVYRRIE